MKDNLRMKNIPRPIILFLVCSVLLITGSSTVFGDREFPKPRGAVNDFANIISSDEEKQMEYIASEVLKKTGTSVVVATIDTVGDMDYSTYANELYESWGIGKKGEDKGVLIFLALKERKLRIETGYGVEGILPDGLVGQIIDNYMVPYLSKNQFGKGIMNGMVILSSIIAKDAGVKLGGDSGTRRPAMKRRHTALGFLPILFFIIIIFLLARSRGGIFPLLLLMMMGRGGGFGGGFGGFSGGFGGFGGGLSGGGGAGRGF